jgi:serine/threonine protein kinase/CRP-like cAMP-binding protein
MDQPFSFKVGIEPPKPATEKFGRYRLFKQIAAGGMGEIFLARSTSLDGFEKNLVIKRILPNVGANERFISMFLDEARVSMSLSHQNIVQVFDFGETDGRYYIAMEHVYGSDLRTILKQPGIQGRGLPPGLALYIISEACKGLDYAHQRRGRNGEPLNLVHCDISPDNILVSFDGAVKLTDFGISKARGQITEHEEGMVIGKFAYMAPEQAIAGAVDARTDVFACGAVLWELLVGKKMYAKGLEESQQDYMKRIATASVTKPSEHNKGIAKRFDRVVMKAVALRPEDRYQSAREMSTDILEVLRWKYRQVDSYSLQSFMEELRPQLNVIGFEHLDPAGDRGRPSLRPGARSIAPPRVSVPPPPNVPETFVPGPDLLQAAEDFRANPSLWEIARMGEICSSAAQISNAIACYRIAAVKFAQHGLLAQSLLCSKLMLEQRGTAELEREIGTYPSLIGRTDERILPYLFRTGGQVEEILAELVVTSFNTTEVPFEEPPPLVAHLGGDGFAQLAKLAPMRRFDAEDRIVIQHDVGKTMYLILSGRALVYLTKSSGDRIYVASLTAGSFFGENSFFSGAPRSATVEATEEVALIEIDMPLYERAMRGHPEAAGILERFYKERIVDSILAQSSTFGLLSGSERKKLLAHFTLQTFEPGSRIIQQGAPCKQLYLVKSGLVDILGNDGEKEKYVTTRGAGTILGELAVVTGGMSANSVVAKEVVEAFVLSSDDIEAVLSKSPGEKRHWMRVAAVDAHLKMRASDH